MTDRGVSSHAEALGRRLSVQEAVVGVIGLGYVGLPLAAASAGGGFRTVGFDIDPLKIETLNAGRSYIDSVAPEVVAGHVGAGRFRASGDFSELAHCDIIAICVPTPLSRHREPDLRFVIATAETIAKSLKPGQLVVLESTTYPGTTEEIVRPILEAGGLQSGRDFFLAFSPEREDPGNATFRTATIPKVVAGDGAEATQLVEAFYRSVVERVVSVSSPKVAEAAKITENIFRAVNIALVNELKTIYDAMGIDVWEVIDAAATKPFGYMPFYPGPGLGGHCIPIDPFYLTWKAREFGLATKFIELAGEINLSMPRYVVDRLAAALDDHQRVSLGSARILLIGLAYKKNVSDIRESPTFELIRLLEQRGSHTDYHDPFLEAVPVTREHAALAGRRSVALTPESVADYDAVLIVTDHDDVDYAMIAESARLVVDTRNVFHRLGLSGPAIVKA
ncbi:MAG TPA: nucleotide sugar dehydrogenase [Aurantimonas sp.]|jgi:UDP-N-acetyl-D-glucosamine dehydrogenase|nr:nucleotide sugar dehydrogenase [Aurantimonas sp.]